MPKTAQRHLIAEFAEELLTINNTPRHIFIEEAHEFIPQRVFGDMGKVFKAVSDVVVMGRNRGIGVTLLNQRAATINKDVLTQLDTLLAFRNTAPQDRKALREWVEHHAAEGDFEQFIQSLPSLPTGEGWIWSPEFLGIFERIKIRERETFHPDREKIGDTFVMPHTDQGTIQQFIGSFSAVPKATPQTHQKPASRAETPAPQAESQELSAVRHAYESQLMQKEREIQRLKEIITQVRHVLGVVPHSSHHGGGLSNGISPHVTMWVEKLGTGGAARILKFLAEKAGMKFTRSQIALAVGLSARSGSYASYIGLLKRNTLIIEQGKEIWMNPDL